MQLLKNGPATFCLVILLVAIAAIIGAFEMSETSFSNYLAAFQAVGVVLALAIGVWTIVAGAHNQRVDRVLSLHAELTGGETDHARRRLATHLRKTAPPGTNVRQASVDELRDEPDSTAYSTDSNHKPTEDAIVVLRFFERVRLAQHSKALDDPMTAELIGRHAGWWNQAITLDDRTSRKALSEFAEWANDFASRNDKRYPYLESWGDTRLRDFGQL